MTGTEVERVEHHGVTALENFVVGKVLEAGRHPDADRLSVCLVDIGDGAASQIVCGAPNVAAGQTVAVARPGAVMPDGTELKVAKLRGQESNGMILAEDEVAIGTEHAGIMVLDDGLAPGTPLLDVLPIATDVLVLEITPNRPDCLGVYGVAREVHAATGAPLAPPPWADDSAAVDGELDAVKITVECPDLCPRFTARVFEDVKIGPSPPWLKARLMAAGQRPISNVVDITNYVMLLTGQPLHAFDLDRVAGARLNVRPATDGETVADARRPDPDARLRDGADRGRRGPDVDRRRDGRRALRGRARHDPGADGGRQLGRRQHPPHLAEARPAQRGLDPVREAAAARAGDGGPGGRDAADGRAVRRARAPGHDRRRRPGAGAGDDPPARRARRATCSASRSRARAAVEILNALEFETADAPDGLDVTVPAFRRADVTREADLIEEVARLGALEKLPATLPSRHDASGRLTDRQRLRRRASDALTAQGLHEIVGWSFDSPELAERLRLADRAVVRAAEPDVVRAVAAAHDAAGHPARRRPAQPRPGRGGDPPVRGRRRLPARATARTPDEPYHVAALLSGPVRPPTWRDPEPPPADFFAAKGVLAGLLDALRVAWTCRGRAGRSRSCTPGARATILVDGAPVGWLGEIHPRRRGRMGSGRTPSPRSSSTSTPSPERGARATQLRRRDELPGGARGPGGDRRRRRHRRARCWRSSAGAGAPLLSDVDVFDVYRDAERIGAGNVSLALRLHFRAPDRTLTDEEVAAKRRQDRRRAGRGARREGP